MERAISEMEKIRRAEEIYSRRNGNNVKLLNKDENVKNKSLYRILFQFLVLFNIAVIVVAVQNKNYIFSNDFLKQADKYNVNIKTKINEMVTYLNGKEILTKSVEETNTVVENNIDKSNVNESDNVSQVNTEVKSVESNGVESETQVEIPIGQNSNDLESNVLGIGGNSAEISEVSSVSQMDLDIRDIKAKYSIILPVSGTKTSGFGTRKASEIVTSYHTGIDIANSRGTVIKAAISGKVVQVSSEGDYGNHLRIAVDDLVTLYAHCDKIYVKEGDEVVQGQDIAEVGSTGNSTGNHLHFEIRYKSRYIDPEKLIEV